MRESKWVRKSPICLCSSIFLEIYAVKEEISFNEICLIVPPWDSSSILFENPPVLSIWYKNSLSIFAFNLPTRWAKICLYSTTFADLPTVPSIVIRISPISNKYIAFISSSDTVIRLPNVSTTLEDSSWIFPFVITRYSPSSENWSESNG